MSNKKGKRDLGLNDTVMIDNVYIYAATPENYDPHGYPRVCTLHGLAMIAATGSYESAFSFFQRRTTKGNFEMNHCLRDCGWLLLRNDTLCSMVMVTCCLYMST